ncbi:hypothetical protein MesoLjLc_51730 [Mesorhizobium sp. L-8-10]|uniref:hypothetical protein n=1 Tax=Mesorhizobium sp. L-8-10 TaxID=2744523 RepID=UPI001929460D|nr:hypothetical protein [Mesorhizobium sp. L-8-10]BCH33243.1 hypothetical protein MesoLjLc_51730 [Mesorhizobium sp. L-8-10]
MSTISCLQREDMMAEAMEAIRYYRLGDRYAALFHIRRALGIAAKLKHAGARKVFMHLHNRMRRKRP